MKDSFEQESLDPAEGITRRRKTRDEEDYRERCIDEFDMVILGEEKIHPADVLDNCAPEVAKRARADAFEQARSATEEIVCDQFPATIAIPFHRFLEGNPQPMRRLHHMRDTWEALIRFLSAVALSQAAKLDSIQTPLLLRQSESENSRECKMNDLYSDRLAIRIGIVEGLVKLAASNEKLPYFFSLIPEDIPSEMRRLNVVRNGFSHESAKSDVQAEKIIEEAYPVLREVLVDLREVRNIELFRVERIRPGSNGGSAEVEKFYGHAQSQRFTNWELDLAGCNTLTFAGDVDGLHRVLAKVDSSYIDLSPFMYSIVDSTGYRTRLLEFKQYKRGKWVLECVADSCTESFDGKAHKTLLSRFTTLTRDGSNNAQS